MTVYFGQSRCKFVSYHLKKMMFTSTGYTMPGHTTMLALQIFLILDAQLGDDRILMLKHNVHNIL